MCLRKLHWAEVFLQPQRRSKGRPERVARRGPKAQLWAVRLTAGLGASFKMVARSVEKLVLFCGFVNHSVNCINVCCAKA